MDITGQWGLGLTHRDPIQFDLGEIQWSCDTMDFLNTITDDPIKFGTPLVLRHAQGDHGQWDEVPLRKSHNDEAKRKREGNVVSLYTVKGTDLFIITTFKEGTTLVMLSKEARNIVDNKLTLDVEEF